MFIRYLFTCLFVLFSFQIHGIELVIGEEKIKPGIVFIFEGAIKDHIFPESLHLAQKNTQIHIEARVNWDEMDIPEAAVPGGFIPYLHITATITNEKTKAITFVDLLPHINLIDNFHYARNIYLPGKISDKYTVTFNVMPPQSRELSFHMDWAENFGKKLLDELSFTYKRVNFKAIAKATR